MKYIFITAHVLLMVSLSLAQGQPTRSYQLNQSVAELYQAGKYDEAITTAEEIVGLERRDASKTQNLINALENLSQIRISRFKKSLADLNSGTLSPESAKSTSAKLRIDGERAEDELREAMRLSGSGATGLRDQKIAIRNNLAWVLRYYQPPDPVVSIGFDKLARDQFESRAKARFYKRINEAESLYQEALTIASAGLDSPDASTLRATYNLAEFALAFGDFENAIARFEKCIADVERVYGKNSPNLVEPLTSYIKALVATGQDDLAFEMVSRLVRVTRTSATMPKTLLNLSLRADKAFAPTNATGVEETARANKERLTLSGRRVTINAGLESILAVSTHGKQYYETGNPIDVLRVPVRVLVDEAGRVVEAEGLITDAALKKDAETTVRQWKLKPFAVGGKPSKMKGYVECTILADRTTK